MRYRALSSTGDSTFGSGSSTFFVNNAEAVAQAIGTRLLLMTGEWFLDLTAGTPYLTDVIGKNTTSLYDPAIRARILGTPGVNDIVNYSSEVNPTTRRLTIEATVDTIYGQVSIAFGAGGGYNPPISFKYAITDQGQPGITDGGQLMGVD